MKLFIFLLLFMSQNVFATVTLLNKNDWKFLFDGFVEADYFYDSARSFTESPGNNPVDHPATYAGDNGRTQFSARNSRFGFSLITPSRDGWKGEGFFEFDFLGYDPTPSGTAPVNSESSFYASPTMRIRQAFVETEKAPWHILAGQSWSIFGWNPFFVLRTVGVPPTTGTLYQRTPELLVLRDLESESGTHLQAGLSIERPTQRDGVYPNVDLGVKFEFGDDKGGYCTPTGDPSLEQTNIAVSGTFRQYEAPQPTSTTTAGGSHLSAGAVAVDVLLPLIESQDKKQVWNTLTATGEFTTGIGYGDSLPGWTGNLPQLNTGTTPPQSSPNLDPGIGGFDSSGNFQLVKLQTWNVQAQYHLSEADRSFATAGYGQLLSVNAGALTPTAGKINYDKSEVIFLNFVHDLNHQIRVAGEISRFTTHYTDGAFASDNRIQFSTWFRF